MSNEKLVCKLKDWLGEDGLKFFSDVKKEHGKIDAVWMEGKLPHPVHFMEGMQVRNFLRKHVDWDSNKLDDSWVELVEKALKQKCHIKIDGKVLVRNNNHSIHKL